jgi:sec-independent protein translocase protein TatB
MGFFDIGIIEIVIILIVILLAVGPEKLPGYARKLGQIIRNFSRIT